MNSEEIIVVFYYKVQSQNLFWKTEKDSTLDKPLPLEPC
jgi:hypothetical protein